MSEPQNPTPQPPFDKRQAKANAAAEKAYRKANRNWFARHKILTGLGALIVLIIIITAASGGGGGDNKPAANDNTGAIDDSGTAEPTATTTAKPKSAPKSTVGQVLLRVKGNGTKTTQKFTAKGDWDLAYTYDCSNFGQQGNFIVMVYGDDNNMSLSNEGVNLLGMKGHDVTHEHHGGTYYLSVNSECGWTLKVTSAS